MENSAPPQNSTAPPAEIIRESFPFCSVEKAVLSPHMCACSRAKGGGNARKNVAKEPAAAGVRSSVLLLLLGVSCSPLTVEPFLTQHSCGGNPEPRRMTGISTPTSHYHRSPRERSVFRRRRSVAAAAAAAMVETAVLSEVGTQQAPGVLINNVTHVGFTSLPRESQGHF